MSVITLYTIVRSTTTNVYIFLDIFYDFVDFNKLATKLFGPGVSKTERLPGFCLMCQGLVDVCCCSNVAV